MDGVTVVTAVLNEGENIGNFMRSLDSVGDVQELVIVDDGSTDSTLETVNSFKGHYSLKLIRRDRKMGTVSAQIAGARQASSEFVVVMDADMQHDPSIIKILDEEIRKGYDIVIASRMVDGGASNRPPVRGIISRGANFLAHLFIPQTRGVRDIMSGYFIARREIVANLRDLKDSYKILLYIFASRRGLRYTEIPYKFQPRSGGESKVVSGLDFLLRYLAELMHYVRVEFNVEG
jgi:dolichol-phosphate mannosyltransferase